MKSISFEQLKTMLKSMSNAIFKRIGILEEKVSPPNKPIKYIYATDENGNAKWTKTTEVIGQIDPIIITNTGEGNEPNYVCNFTAEELWNIDANVIQQNARIIDGDKQYAVRGVNKILEPFLYGKVIQFTADLNAAYYDLVVPFNSMVLTLIGYLGKKMYVEYTQTLMKKPQYSAPFQRDDYALMMIHRYNQWQPLAVTGFKGGADASEPSVSPVLNVISSDYSALIANWNREENPTYMLDIKRISIVQAVKDGDLSGVVLYYTDSHESTVGKMTTLERVEVSNITHTYADVVFIMKKDENGKYARITLNESENYRANVEWLTA